MGEYRVIYKFPTWYNISFRWLYPTTWKIMTVDDSFYLPFKSLFQPNGHQKERKHFLLVRTTRWNQKCATTFIQSGMSGNSFTYYTKIWELYSGGNGCQCADVMLLAEEKKCHFFKLRQDAHKSTKRATSVD